LYELNFIQNSLKQTVHGCVAMNIFVENIHALLPQYKSHLLIIIMQINNYKLAKENEML